MLEAEFSKATVEHWTLRLGAAGIPAGPVNDIPTALADPHLQTRGMVQTVHHPVTGDIALIGPVAKMSNTPAAIQKPPPLLGEHTFTVLNEWLGYSETKIQDLSARGVI
jgi:crotonobetainyl-CoA:carnitine CoA-transferase CaiB-like acyl-CoA transferase